MIKESLKVCHWYHKDSCTRMHVGRYVTIILLQAHGNTLDEDILMTNVWKYMATSTKTCTHMKNWVVLPLLIIIIEFFHFIFIFYCLHLWNQHLSSLLWQISHSFTKTSKFKLQSSLLNTMCTRLHLDPGFFVFPNAFITLLSRGVRWKHWPNKNCIVLTMLYA